MPKQARQIAKRKRAAKGKPKSNPEISLVHLPKFPWHPKQSSKSPEPLLTITEEDYGGPTNAPSYTSLDDLSEAEPKVKFYHTADNYVSADDRVRNKLTHLKNIIKKPVM